MPCLSACRNFDSTLVIHVSDDEGFIGCNISSNTPDRMILEASALHYRGRPKWSKHRRAPAGSGLPPRLRTRRAESRRPSEE